MFPQIEYELHASLVRVLSKVATLLPAIIALALALLISALVGLLLGYLVRRLLVAIHFDEHMRSHSTAGLLASSSVRSPSLIVSSVIFWACIVCGAVVGISAFASAYSDSEHLAAQLFPYVGRCVGAALIFFAGSLAARFLARTVLIGAVNLNLHYARFLSQGVKWMVMVLTIAMALDHLSIGGLIVELAFGILFGGIVLTLAISIGNAAPQFILQSFEHNEQASEEESRHSSVRHF
jgi:hypothetical protein